MGISDAITLLTSSFGNTAIFGEKWILGLVIIAVTCLMITREYTKWGALILPVMVGWRISGIYFSPMIFLLAAVTFTITALQGSTVGDILIIKKRYFDPKRVEGNTTQEKITAIGQQKNLLTDQIKKLLPGGKK